MYSRTEIYIFTTQKGQIAEQIKDNKKRLMVGKQAVHAGLLLFAGIAVNIVNCGKAVLTLKYSETI